MGKLVVRPKSLRQRIADYFEANPDEMLSYKDIGIKFSCSPETARSAVDNLKTQDARFKSAVMVFLSRSPK